MDENTHELARLKGVSMASLNIRSLYRCIDDLRSILPRTELDVLVLQETFLNTTICDAEVDIGGYQMFRFDRTEASGKSKGGGLVTYVSNRYSYEHVAHLNECNRDCELQCVKLSLPETRSTFIINAYRPPDGDIKAFIEILSNLIDDLTTSSNPDILVMGDINIDLKKSTPSSNKIKQLLQSRGMVQLIKDPTRVSNTGNTLIDHIYTNNNTFYDSCGVYDIGLSDHSLIYVTRHRKKAKHKTYYIYGRSYRNFDETLFRHDISNAPWTNVFSKSDVNAATETFNNIFISVANVHTPYKRIKCRTNQPKWITAEFLSLIDEREHWFNVYRRRPSQEIAAKKRISCRRVARMKRLLKRNYIHEALESCKGDSKKTWRILKELWPTSSKKQNFTEINRKSNPQDIANELNNHFVTIGPQLSAKLNSNDTPSFVHTDPETSFSLHHVTFEEVSEQIGKTSPSKSCGVDGITARLLKASGDAIVPPLVYIFNRSIDTGSFPDAWKIARVTPLHKDGNLNNMNNYRPISVLPVVSKIFERLVHDQTYKYVSDAGILTDRQSGFRKRHSTGTCLVEFLDAIYDGVENDRLSGVLFLDLKKAFDTVDHNIAINILSNMNMSPVCLQWYRSYLSNRSQVTQVNNVLSDKMGLKCGVPQGSILGPLLFILYINTLPSALEDSDTFLYADDTAIVCKGNNHDEVNSKLSKQLTKAHTWLCNHKLSLNLAKTKIMYFGTANKTSKNSSSNLSLEVGSIEVVTSFKYLGIMLDTNLTFKPHVDYLLKKLYPKLKTLGRIRSYIGESMALYLYNSLIGPLFSFNDHVYDALKKVDADRLQVAQNKSLRMCLRRNKMTSRREIFSKSGVMPLHVQRNISTLATVHKALNMNSTPYINDMFSLNTNDDSSRRLTRSQIRGDVKVNKCRLEMTKSNIRHRGAVYFNNVPIDARGIETTKAFVNKLRRTAKAQEYF